VTGTEGEAAEDTTETMDIPICTAGGLHPGAVDMVAAVMAAAVINCYVYLTRAQEIRRLIVKYITVSRFGLKEKKS